MPWRLSIRPTAQLSIGGSQACREPCQSASHLDPAMSESVTAQETSLLSRFAKAAACQGIMRSEPN
jgi:hypothetical protein